MQKIMLKLALVICLMGQLFLSTKFGTSINGFQFLILDFSDQFSTSIDMTFCFFVTLATITLTFYSQIKFAAFFIFGWFLTLALTKTILHGSFGWEVAIFAYAARYCLPLCLYYFSIEKRELALKIAIFGVSSTFIAHGIEAMMLNPIFLDYMYDFSEVYLNIVPTQKYVETGLFFIGMVDILVGAALIFSRNKNLVLYIAAWGLITALSRITYHGYAQWYEFFLRIPHFALPMFIYFNKGIKFQPLQIFKNKDQVQCQS
ncbi:hypothetical protein OAT67_06955 [Bacteriovoracaceae bacterium]|nr:hypothetical protein [Bacteriovoracaceae bacterium]